MTEPPSELQFDTDQANRKLETVDIQLLPNSDPAEFCPAIKALPQLKSVDVSCLNSRERQLQWNSDNVKPLFETIGSLPNLRKVQFKFLGGGDMDNMVPLHLFSCLLNQSACHLESLRMTLIGPINCDVEDMIGFSQALRQQRYLKEFRLSCCYFAHEVLTSSCSMDPVLEALSALPSLETVSLKAASKGHLGNLRPDSLGALSQSSALKDLTIDNFVLNNNHIAAVSRQLRINTHLEDMYLNLSGELNLDSKLLPEAIQENRGLRKLQMRLSHQKKLENFLVNVATALHRNNTLKEFGVFGSIRISDDIEPSFHQMLESNCVLETLVLPSNYKEGWREKIDMLLWLNGRGRQRLVCESDSVSRDEWIEIFTNTSNNLSFVYYYLRRDPLLCKLIAGV